MMQPAITGRQQSTSKMMRILGIRLESHPVRRMKMKTTPPSGNCRRIESRVVHPNVDTIRGPKPETAPLTVYLPLSTRYSLRRPEESYAAAIMNAISQILKSKNVSRIWVTFNF